MFRHRIPYKNPVNCDGSMVVPMNEISKNTTKMKAFQYVVKSVTEASLGARNTQPALTAPLQPVYPPNHRKRPVEGFDKSNQESFYQSSEVFPKRALLSTLHKSTHFWESK